jgi:hypothetical protein
MADLQPIAQELKAFADCEWSHCLNNLPVAFGKGVIEIQTDLEACLAALGKDYAAELENHTRITL